MSWTIQLITRTGYSTLQSGTGQVMLECAVRLIETGADVDGSHWPGSNGLVYELPIGSFENITRCPGIIIADCHGPGLPG